jgi:hypothetical protein
MNIWTFLDHNGGGCALFIVVLGAGWGAYKLLKLAMEKDLF